VQPCYRSFFFLFFCLPGFLYLNFSVMYCFFLPHLLLLHKHGWSTTIATKRFMRPLFSLPQLFSIYVLTNIFLSFRFRNHFFSNTLTWRCTLYLSHYHQSYYCLLAHFRQNIVPGQYCATQFTILYNTQSLCVDILFVYREKRQNLQKELLNNSPKRWHLCREADRYM
jgi:hypothetical protein